MDKIRRFLEELGSSPEAQALLDSREKPRNAREEIRAYAEVARSIGSGVSEEDLAAYIAEREKAVRERTDAACAGISELPAEQLSIASGGKGHDSCKYSYKDYENCWHTDGCDHIYQSYPDYYCHYFSLCGKQGMPLCDSHEQVPIGSKRSTAG